MSLQITLSQIIVPYVKLEFCNFLMIYDWIVVSNTANEQSNDLTPRPVLKNMEIAHQTRQAVSRIASDTSCMGGNESRE